MSIELLKQNSKSVLESIDSYDHLIEQRAKTGNKREVKKIDAKIEDGMKHVLDFCQKV